MEKWFYCMIDSISLQRGMWFGFNTQLSLAKHTVLV